MSSWHRMALTFVLAAAIISGCIPQNEGGGGDGPAGDGGEMIGDIPGDVGGSAGGPTGGANDPGAGGSAPSGAGGGMAPRGGGIDPIFGGQMNPNAGGAHNPGAGGGPAPDGGGAMAPRGGAMEPQPEPEPEPDPCAFPNREGRWFHLPDAGKCVFYSILETLDYDDARAACRELGASLPHARDLDRHCDDIHLRPDHIINDQRVSSKVRVADSYSDGHRLWHDRGYNSTANDCGVRSLGCGYMGYNADCIEINTWISDSRRYKFACLRNERRPPPPPREDAGLDPPEDAGPPPPPEPDMAPRPPPLVNTRFAGAFPREHDPDDNHRFSFAAVGDGAIGFECQLDDGPWFRCESPFRVEALAEGEHTFRVAALNGDGIADRTPVEHTWIVDTVPPRCGFTRTEIRDPMQGQVGCRGNAGITRWFDWEEGYEARCRQDIIPNSGRHDGAHRWEGRWGWCDSPHFFQFNCAGTLSTANVTLLEMTDRAGNTCSSEAFGVRWECDRCN